MACSLLKLLAQDGATNVVLAGHSKGGALIMEYLCEVAEGRRQMITDQNGRATIAIPMAAWLTCRCSTIP